MALPFGVRVKKAWNAFWNARDPTRDFERDPYWDYGTMTSQRPDRMVYTRGNERTIITSIFNRIATDVAAVNIRHVKLDENGRLEDFVTDGLDTCLNREANIDQTGRAFIHDAVATLLDEGCIAIVMTDTSEDPAETEQFDIYAMRVGKVVQWHPRHVRVDLYNDIAGRHEEVTLPKKQVAIVENPFYAVMNQPSSTMQRLVRKLNLLDKIDNDIGANRLDLIIQLPYIVRTDQKRAQANQRREDIEKQLAGSKYGVAYTDATEKVTQLNRPLENTLLGQIQYLVDQLYAQIGMSQAILDGTADEATMLNYNNRIVDPILLALTEEMTRKFLSKTARSQRHIIKYFQDPFRLVPVAQLAEIADKFTRNEILTSNEIRQIVGIKPSSDPGADELRNKNLSKSNEDVKQPVNGEAAARQALNGLGKIEGKN